MMVVYMEGMNLVSFVLGRQGGNENSTPVLFTATCGATHEKNGKEHQVFTVCDDTGVLLPSTASSPRGLWGWRDLATLSVEDLRPPGLSERSFIFASWSIRPALRSAFVAIARLPGAGVGLENVGWDMAGSSGAFVPSELCG